MTAAATDPTPAPEAEQQSTDVEPQPEPKKPGKVKKAVATGKAAAANSKLIAGQPLSLREAWHRSGTVDYHRVPADSELLAKLWWFSNHSDRIALFGLYFIAPAGLAGAVLYLAERPTRRWAMYLVVTLVGLLVPAIAVAKG